MSQSVKYMVGCTLAGAVFSQIRKQSDGQRRAGPVRHWGNGCGFVWSFISARDTSTNAAEEGYLAHRRDCDHSNR